MPHILANLSAAEDLIEMFSDRMQMGGILTGNRPNGEICLRWILHFIDKGLGRMACPYPLRVMDSLVVTITMLA